jgi:hypothetical protein
MKQALSAAWVYAAVAVTSGFATSGTAAAVPAAAGQLVFNVRDYGATGNGTTDDTVAIRKAQAAAEAAASAQAVATIYLPTGTYAVCPQPGDTSPPGTSFYLPIFVTLKGNVTWKGDGADKSILKGYCAGMKNPVTTWTVTGNSYFKISRFGMFAGIARAPVTGTLRWEGLTIDGQGPYTGNSTVGGVPATGDGWDMTHKGFQFDGSKSIDAVEIVSCNVINWRGENVYAGGTALKTMSLQGSTIAGSNASAVSVSTALTMDKCTVGGPGVADQVYNGLENFEVVASQKTVITNSLIQPSPAAAKAHGNGIAWLGVSGATLSIENSTFQYCTSGILFSDLGHNATFTNVTFSGCTRGAIVASLGLYPTFPRGFSDISFKSCTFNGGTGFIGQSQDITNLQFSQNTVEKGTTLFAGTYGKCNGFTAANTIIKSGGSSVGTVSGTGVPLWSGTVSPTWGVRVCVFNKASQVTVAPWNELTFLDNQTPVVKGGIAIELDPKAHNYQSGFTTKVYATRAGQWYLKADASKNTFKSNLPVPVKGLSVRFDSNGKWELVP